MQDPATPPVVPSASTPAPTPASTPAPTAVNSPTVIGATGLRGLIITIGAVVTVCGSVLAIVAVMCYRVAVDGNAPLTSDITTKMAVVAGLCILSMTVSLFGNNSLIVKALAQLTP